MNMPSLFIGSSIEGLEVARTLEELLENDAKITLWTSDAFGLSDTLIESLFELLDRCDSAIFIMTPDDLVISRDEKYHKARDNVIFEAGLFFGRLGRKRTILVRHKDVKPPSDLEGMTFATYGERYKENPKAGLGPAASRIRRQLAQIDRYKEIDFIKSYINFIQPSTSLSDDYQRILSRNYNKLNLEVKKLESHADWETLLEVKIRLREFFEYTGKYLEGAEVGRRYVKALEALSQPLEAIWTKAKHVGYLLILAGNHKDGRKEILESIDTLNKLDTKSSDSAKEFLFYCYRYLGISFQRDELTGDINKAVDCFNKADEYIQSLRDDSKKQKELKGRLLGNYGNLALNRNEFTEALQNFKASLAIFEELEDEEHLGIANLQIAQTTIASGQDIKDAISYLERAESIFVHLAWIEGQGRVSEQYAKLYLRLTMNASDTKERQEYLDIAISSAKRSKGFFENIQHQKGLGRIDIMMDNLKQLKSVTSNN